MRLGRQFGVQAGLRAVLLAGGMLTLAYVVFRTEFVVTPVVLVAVCAGLLVELLSFVRRTNREVTRFFDSIRHADFSHRLDPGLRGVGFQELAASMSAVVERLQGMRRAGEEERQRLRALVEHVPVPMFGVIGRERIVLHNHAARRFFGAVPVTTIDDLERFGPDLVTAVRQSAPGRSVLVRLAMDDGSSARMTMSLTEIVVGREHQRLVTLQNITDELAASELEAWQQMAQVLAHEIMNSLTPVASLADTARSLLENADPASQQQAHDAIATVAQRADALMGFVQGYRRFSRLPAPQPEVIDARQLLSAMADLVRAEAEQAGVVIDVRIETTGLSLRADRQQLEQVVINLLRNALAAVADVDDPTIRLVARLGRSGRPVIEVHDNGDGIPDALRDRVFVPYYSTREGGSGVGLALTRQVMAAHGGTASVSETALGGARIMLQF